MKKLIALFLFLIIAASTLSSLNLKGIDKWITNFPHDKITFLDYSISNCVIEESGVLLELKKNWTTVRITLIKQISIDDLTKKITAIENNILGLKTLQSEKWNIQVKQAEISLGLKDDIRITLKIDAFRFKLNNRTILELKNKLTDDPLFTYIPETDTFIYSLMFKGINLDTGNKDSFPGWQEFINKLILWFQNGIKSNNTEIMALVLETKVMNIIEAEKEKKILMSKEDRSNNWLGFNLDYLVPNLISGEYTGVYFNPFSYNMLQPMIHFNFRNIGRKEWIVKPFQFYVFIGGFLEFNAAYFSRKNSGEFEDFSTSNGSFAVAGGPSFGFSFSAMIPRIVEGKQTGELFGIGIEVLSAINIPYFFKDYYYEYSFNQFINFVIHLIPTSKVRSDIIIGMNLAFANKNYDENNNSVVLSKFGFVIGARLKINIFNFYKTLKLFS